jgi:hypothetical protein
MQKIRVLVLILAVLTLFPATNVFADMTGPPRDFSVESPNGEFILVMLAHSTTQEVIKDVFLRKNHPQSGLYRNDRSHKLLWAVDWGPSDASVSSDGHHVVRWGSVGRQGEYFFQTALEFYRDGKLLKRYMLDDLVANPFELPHTVSSYHWDEDYGHDDATNTIWVQTYEGRRYVFDMTTGKLIEGRLLIGLTKLIYGGALAIVALPLGLAWRLYQKRKAKQQAAKA